MPCDSLTFDVLLRDDSHPSMLMKSVLEVQNFFSKLQFPYHMAIHHSSVKSACSAGQRDWTISHGGVLVSAMFQNRDNGRSTEHRYKIIFVSTSIEHLQHKVNCRRVLLILLWIPSRPGEILAALCGTRENPP
jgi:hypothetical protein